MRTYKIFRGTDGINTRLDPARIQYDHRTGIVDLAAAVNVAVDDTGRISRMKGFTHRQTGDIHSLFCEAGDVCLCVRGDALSIVEPDLALTPIRNVHPGALMSYAQVGHRIFYANGIEKGYVDVRDRLSHAWTQGAYVGPDTHRQFIDPPSGTVIRYYNGRVLIAQGDTLWMTEPLDYTRVDPVRGHIPFETGAITSIRPAGGCVYVSAGRAVWALVGRDVGTDVARLPVSDVPMVAGTDVNVFGRPDMLPDGRIYIDTRQRVLGALWTARDGIYYGGADGAVVNLTRDRLADLPAATTGAAMISDHTYITILNP